METKYAFFILLCVLSVGAEYTLKLRLIEYNNPSKRLADGSCCDRSFTGCGDCDPIFSGCLTDRQQIQKPCNLGSFETQQYPDTNSVKFNSSLGVFLRNPIALRNWFPWKGNISLRIFVIEKDTLGVERINVFHKEDLSLEAGTTASLSEEVIMPPFVGPQNSTLKYGVRVYCSRYFYGSDCTTYCKPEDDDVKGHFVCDKHGNKVCRDGFNGEQCLSVITTIAPTTFPATSLPQFECGGIINASKGRISVYGKEMQNANSCGVIHCHWKIVLPKGQKTQMSFSDFFPINDDLKCIESMVTITVRSEVLTFYCRDIPPGGGQVRVKETEVDVDAVVAPGRWMLESGFTLNYGPLE